MISASGWGYAGTMLTSLGARTITVREHPNRWRAWDVASSSQKPSRKTPDVLEFSVDVPATGKATLDYLLHYAWTAADENGGREAIVSTQRSPLTGSLA